MGDRSNIQFSDGKNVIDFYSHWGGREIQADAIKFMQSIYPARADDPAYFTRRVIAFLLQGTVDEETGSGLWVSSSGVEHPTLSFIWNDRWELEVSYGISTWYGFDEKIFEEILHEIETQNLQDFE